MKEKFVLLIIFLLGLFLRLYQVGQVPPALYWDEASLGYNGYAISQNLKDEHGRFLPFDYFTAYGDYKPPGYIYAVAASIKLLGLNEIAVRLPSVLAGSFLIFITYFLTKELLDKKSIALFAAFIVAVSPWGIQMSRGAFEANLATLFSSSGILLFLRAVRKNSHLSMIFSGIFFVLSIYTFNSHRIFAPLIIVVLGLLFKRWKMALMLLAVFILLALPLLPHLTSSEGRLRFNEVTWLKDLNPIMETNNKIVTDGGGLIPKLIHNRRLVWAGEFAKHYLDHFRPDFLFLTGDINARFSSQTTGIFYLWDLPLLLGGIYLLIRNRNRFSLVILAWISLGLIPAAMARETPHALRILNIFPAPQIVLAVGAEYFFRRRKIIFLGLAIGYFISVLFFFHDLISHYSSKYSQDWQYGYKELVKYVSLIQDKYDNISITSKYGRPYIYFLLYQNYPPEKYWQDRDASRDSFGFWTVRSFDKYKFIEEIGKSGKWLYVRQAGELPTVSSYLYSIKDLSGKTVFEISESQ